MRLARTVAIAALLLPIAAQCEQSYRVYTEHPRLWLNARHLRLLRRERERNSVRWQQLELLRKSGQPLPEQPLVDALQYQVAGDEAAGKQAVAWAVKRASGSIDVAQLRQLAVVFDWCYPLFGEAERARVVTRAAQSIGTVATQSGMQSLASAVLASIALADDWPGSEQALTKVFEQRWRETGLASLQEGRATEAPADRVALMEMCHAVRDNLNLEIWDQAPAYFKQFPIYLLLQYYPEPVVVDGHHLHAPAMRSGVKGDPAVLGEQARIAELLTVAYETNSVETQFVQGWLTHEIYRLQTPSGAFYEFLWLNPYQPGLSYYNVPLFLHDPVAGRLWARSTWDDDAAWVGYFNREMQLYAEGQQTIVNLAQQSAPIVFPQVAIVTASRDRSFKVRLSDGKAVFVVGLTPGATYWAKVGDEDFAPQAADKGGILEIRVEPEAETTIELRSKDPTPPPPPPPEKKKRK